MRPGRHPHPHLRTAARRVAATACSAFLSVCIACANTADGSLESRTLPEEKRYEFLRTRGPEAPPAIRDAFIDGRIVPGMQREWVLEMYGRPDRILDGGWEYLDRKGKTILAVSFREDVVDSVIAYIRAGSAPFQE